MTGATSTSAGGGPVDARTLLLLQPSELDNNAAPMNPAKTFFFIVRFLAIELLARKSHDNLLSYVRMRHKGHFAALLQCYRLCIMCNDSKICRKNLLTEMQHGGESSSMLPATASLNLAMRRARSKILPNRQPYRDR